MPIYIPNTPKASPPPPSPLQPHLIPLRNETFSPFDDLRQLAFVLLFSAGVFVLTRNPFRAKDNELHGRNVLNCYDVTVTEPTFMEKQKRKSIQVQSLSKG